jgi:hypothetical protein
MVRKCDLCAQDYEDLRQRKTEMINEHLVECYNRLLKEEDINLLIRLHRNFINKMMINGKAKNKYKTLDFLIHYRNTIKDGKNEKNKKTALRILMCCLNNRDGFKVRGLPLV